ncbi:hypothetical protein JCM11641_004017 [Rhodosporidiobolus odoratus]
MDTRPPPSTPTSLLNTAHSLHSGLLPLVAPLPTVSSSVTPSTRPPAALLHGLGPTPSTSLPALRSTVTHHLANLRTAVSHFSTLVHSDPPSISSPNDDHKTRDRDKYLALLKESAGHEATLVASSTSSSASTGSLLAHRRTSTYSALFPALSPSALAQPEPVGILSNLEKLATQTGLVAFRDDQGQEETNKVTLSLGGKVMVVDFEVVRSTRQGGEAGFKEEKVDKVKVAYVAEGEDRVCTFAGDMLFSLLSPPSAVGEEGIGKQEVQEDQRREAKEQRWKSIRNLLDELKHLDAATERTGRDCFRSLDVLRTALEASFPSASPSDSDASHSFPSLLPLSSPASLYPSLLLHATPTARLSSSFSRTLPSPSSSCTLSNLRREGIYTATLTLGCLVDEASPKGGVETPKQTQKPEYGVVVLNPPVPVSREVGKSIVQALEEEESRGGKDKARGPEEAGAEHEEGQKGDRGGRSEESGQGRVGGRGGVVWHELLLSPRSGQSSGRMGEGNEASVTGERVWEITWAPSPSPASSSSSSLSLSFRLSPTSSTIASPEPNYFLATHLRFPLPSSTSSSSPTSSASLALASLTSALSVLDAQIRLNELIRSLERRSREGGPKGGSGQEGEEARGEGGRRKRRKLWIVKKEVEGGSEGKGREGEMTLEELFVDTPNSTSSLPLPIHLSLSLSAASSPPLPPNPSPTLTLSFPTPHLPPSSACPMTLTISALSSASSPSPFPSSSASSSSSASASLTWQAYLQGPPDALEDLAAGGAEADHDDDDDDDDEDDDKGQGRIRLKKLEEILDLSGDLGLGMRWLVNRLRS